MKTGSRRKGLDLACACVAAALLAGCVSTDPAPQEMSRTTLATAPADLQLLCANEVARLTGLDQARVLPKASRQLDSRTYQVEIDTGGQLSSCIIDDDGVVKSVVAA